MTTLGRRRSFLMVAVAASLIAMSSCATASHVQHGYLMRGSIIEKKDGKVYLCIGAKDGAMVGQVLKVYRVDKSTSGSPKAPISFTKVETGTIKVVSIVDEHFAMADVISGAAEVGYIAETNR